MAETAWVKFVDGPKSKEVTKQTEPWLSAKGNPVRGNDIIRFQKDYTNSPHEGLYELVKLPVTGALVYQWRVKG